MIHLSEVAMEVLSPSGECLLQQRFPIQIEDVKSAYANLGLEVLFGHIFATTLSEDLEWQYAVINRVVGYELRVQNEVIYMRLVSDRQLNEVDNIRVLNGHTF